MIFLLWVLLDEEEQDFYTDLFTKYADAMWLYANSLLSDSALADDVVQLAFLKLMRSASRIQGVKEEKRRAYVATTVRNTARELLRKRREVPVEDVEGMGIDAAGSEEDELDLVDSYYSLPILCRDAMLYRYKYAMTCKEIDRHLGISEKAAQKRIERGKEMARREAGWVGSHEEAAK